ncbi:MAG TPA: Calx-beta domain-containing protein [Candidatus Hydrogenedentes bacterium]|nr:Calx-beta domain-containing protein [Candidatus Hydrogenedentota bacterium]
MHTSNAATVLRKRVGTQARGLLRRATFVLAACLFLPLCGTAWAVQVLYQDDFESEDNLENWALSGDWRFKANSACLPNQLGYNSPSTALVFDYAGECAYRNSRIGFAAMRHDITIPITLPTVTLEWQDYVGAEVGSDFYFVQVSTDGGASWPIEIFRDSVDETFWDVETVDLTAFIGQQIRLRFGFVADATITNYGWYVDDVRIFGEPLAEGVSAIALNGATVTEGDAGTVSMGFTLDIQPPNLNPIELEHATVNGTAIAGLDFTGTSGPLEIPANMSTYTINVAILGDALFEPTEFFELVISNPSSNATITLDRATGTILDDDDLECLYEEDFETPEGTFPWTTGYPPSQQPNDPDCTPDPNDPGCALKLWHIQPVSQCLTGAAGPGYRSPTHALVFNDEATCTYDTPGGVEGSVAMTSGIDIPDVDALTAQLSFKHFLEIAYNAIQPQATTAYVEISTNAGIDWEILKSYSPPTLSDEHFVIPWSEEVISLSEYLGKDVFIRFRFVQPDEINSHQARGWYIDDFKICYAPRPSGVSKVIVDDASGQEGNVGSGLLSFPVTVVPQNPQPITLSFTTAPVTAPNAAIPDVDYVSTSGSRVIPANTSAGSFDIVLIGDDQPEPSEEKFKVNVLGVSPNVYLVNSEAIGTILDDDTPSTFSVGVKNTNPPVVEVPEAAGTVTFDVVLSQARTVPITVTYTTEDITALAGQGLDYLPSSGTLTFPANTTKKTMTVTILDDNQQDPDETFYITLTTESSYAQGGSTAITIIDNEPGPPPGASDLTIGDTSVVEGSCANISVPAPCDQIYHATFLIELDHDNAGDISMDYFTTGLTATDGEDYIGIEGTVTIPAFTTQAVLTVDIQADRKIEGGADRAEYFDLVLFNPQGNVNVISNRGRCTIRDDDFEATLFGLNEGDITLRDLDEAVPETSPLVGVPLDFTAAEFKGFDYSRLFGFHNDFLVAVNLVNGTYSNAANLSAITTGNLSGLAWDHTNGRAIVTSTSGEVLVININNGTVLSNQPLGPAWEAVAVHPTSGRIYGIARNGAAAELYQIQPALTGWQCTLIGNLTGVTAAAGEAGFWDCDFDDRTGKLYVNVYVDGGADPDYWETLQVDLRSLNAPGNLDTRVILQEPPVSSMAIATPPPPPSVEWTGDLYYDGGSPTGMQMVGVDNAGVGRVVTGIGDVNGDTFEDFMFTAPDEPVDSLTDAGMVFIFFGGPAGTSSIINDYLRKDAAIGPDNPDASQEIVITGSAASEHLGLSATGLGDMNGDGIAEFALGWTNAANRGGVFLIYGSRTFPASFATSSIGDTAAGAAVKGVKIIGADDGDGAGASVAKAGDFDANGLPDLIVGAPTAGAGAAPGAGAAYIVFGSSSGIGSNGLIQLQALAPTQGIRILGETVGSGFGTSVSGIGDFNGDGVEDVAIGAPAATSNQGNVIIIFGHVDYKESDAPNPINLARLSDGNMPSLPNSLYFTLNMPDEGGLASMVNPGFLTPPFQPGDLGLLPGMRLTGEGGGFGKALSSLGDANGDGIDDMITAAPTYDGSAAAERHWGRCYLVLGAAGELHQPESLASDVGSSVPGLLLTGIDQGDAVGASVAGAGDINGDGLMDALIGAANGTPGGFGGEAYVLWGSRGLQGELSLRDLSSLGGASSPGKYLYSTHSGTDFSLGLCVAAAGDLNSDNVGDYLVGRKGGAFVLLGSAITEAAEYKNRIRSAVGLLGNLPGGDTVGLDNDVHREVGLTGNGSVSQPVSRVTINFTGGGFGSELLNASTQSVTLYRRAAPDVPVGNGPEDDDKWIPAGVHWLVLTDRDDFSNSTIEFYYRPGDVAGLNLDKIGVFYAKPGAALSENTAWSWLPFVHDPDRGVFSVTRKHNDDPQAEFNGYYALIQADLITYLGGVIPAVGVTPDNLSAKGPVVSPPERAFWHSREKRLYAVNEGPLTIQWRNLADEIVSEVQAYNLWPPASRGVYQDYIADSTSINLSSVSDQITFQYAKLTDYDDAFVNLAPVDSDKVLTEKSFKAKLNVSDVSATARALVLLSTQAYPDQGNIYFQFVRVVQWSNPEVIKGGASGVQWPVGQYIAGATDTNYATYHDEATGSPYVLFGNAPYAPYTARYPGFYDRATRTGTIVPVNVKRGSESDLVLAFYQQGRKLLDGTTGGFVLNPSTHQPIPSFAWPYAATKYLLGWPSGLDTIVIAKQNGTGELDITKYGAELDVYVQNTPSSPGFNPNEEHAIIAPYGGGQAMFALRNDLNKFSNPSASDFTSAPCAILVYRDPNDLTLDGTPRMKTQPFSVVATQGIYTFGPWPGVSGTEDPYEGTAGDFIQPPYPLSIFAYSADNTYTSDSADYVFEDRTGHHWAKSATGTEASLKMHFYYPVKDDFYFPQAYLSKYPDRNFVVGGDDVPFLDGGPSVERLDPVDVQYQTIWPDDIPTMNLGEVLIEAKYGLPQINGQCSVDVVYMESGAAAPSVRLIDPVITREVPLTGVPADAAVGNRGPEIVFPTLPPALNYRLSYDPLRRMLQFKGILIDPVTGFDYVLLNVFSTADKNLILALSADGSNTNSDWYKAVDALATLAADVHVINNSATDPYTVLALTTGNAQGTGYVTLAMQNATQCSPLPVSLEIMKVADNLNPGKIAVVKPACVFEEKLTLMSTLDFGGHPENFEFEWLYVPDDGGTIPDPPDPADPTDPWDVPPLGSPASGTGLNTITIQGPGLLTLTDNWFALRYKRVGGAEPWGDNWSTWTPAQLAEGWIKRVVGEINPYNQRASGGGIEGAEQCFASFGTEAPNTLVSMISQAGPRWTGSVPLNCDNLDDFGLIPIYETVLNRGADLSINALSPVDNPGVNTALLLVASRICELYALLGNEAYADAEDPTIAFGTEDGTYGAEATTIHAFMNQTSSLLEEELALLRGRDDTFAPSVEVYPVYNRLMWNFTNDMTGGEVAYAMNYNILDAVEGGDGVISEADAKRLYPQGHGDAWGHYLTAMTTYYMLLRHPFYTWVPRSEAKLVGGEAVTVDYLDERKFASVAAAKAKAGAEIVNLTYRSAYVEDPEDQWQGLKDTKPERAWGFSEWATRAGQGAYIDWVAANAILRAEDPVPEHTSIQKIDRTTVLDINQVALDYGCIQAKVDEADLGLNPLGLGNNVIPFDISPSLIDDGLTHFEQIWDRAKTALNNAAAAFNHANDSTQLLRKQNDSIQQFQRTVLDTELDYQARLIEIFGYPYEDDIGPGGLYAEGYDGPDLYHYMLSDDSALQQDSQYQVLPYNTTSTGDTQTNIPSIAESLADDFAAEDEYNVGTGEYVFEVTVHNYGAVQTCDPLYEPPDEGEDEGDHEGLDDIAGCASLAESGVVPDVPITVEYNMAMDKNFFGITKPSSWTGQRRAPGEIQNARSDLIQAVGGFMDKVESYNAFVAGVEDQLEKVEAQYGVSAEDLQLMIDRKTAKKNAQEYILGMKGLQFGLRTLATIVNLISEATKETVPTVTGIIVGFSNGIIIDGLAPVRGGLGLVGSVIVEALKAAADGVELAIVSKEQEGVRADDQLAIDKQELAAHFTNMQTLLELENMLRNESNLRLALHTSHEGVLQAIGNYQRALADGLRTIERWELFHRQTSADVQEFRYKDMAFRLFRNEALQKYRAQFDLAARYAYLAAKAYDYETTMLSSDPLAGQKFLTNIVRSRQLGTIADGEPQTGTGLADSMAVMARNFQVLSGQLGFNNPQVETNRFSLRHELFRTLPAADNPNDSTWRDTLSQDYATFGVGIAANLWDVTEFRQFCVPPDGFGLVEPGLVIPFGTTIKEGENFFGNDMGGLDSSYDSTQFATKIRSVGVWFSNYNALSLSSTPRVWLVPAGVDRMRSPSDTNGKTRSFVVLDQVLPVPFPIGESDLEIPTWIPSVDSLAGNLVPIRRYGRFRAYHDSGEFTESEMQRDSRLIGRSVWNSKWMLIIPASTLNSDREEGLARFIQGRMVNGVRDGNGVSDIKLFFETYAFPRLKKAEQTTGKE